MEGCRTLQLGEKIIHVEKAYSTREGLPGRTMHLPMRLLGEPTPEGPSKGRWYFEGFVGSIRGYGLGCKDEISGKR